MDIAALPPFQSSVPQKNTFKFEYLDHPVIFSSDFDSGNISKVARNAPTHFSVWTAADCQGTDKEGYPKSWFYLSVSGFQSTTVTISVHRIHVLWSLLRCPEKYRPVFRVSGPDTPTTSWARLETPVKTLIMNSDNELVLTFEYRFKNKTDTVEFAYTYPYTYTQLQQDIKKLNENYTQDKEIFYRQHVLVKSLEKRNIDLIMISNHEGKEDNSYENFDNSNSQMEGVLENEKLVKFRHNKPIILITARVHPLETPSSFCMKGIIEFLLNKKDARAYFLRKYFVFVLVPMLNPDGVFRGHCRMDTLNQNLNRYYQQPTLDKQPSCLGIRRLAEHYNKDKRLFFYLDLHAHPANKGNFIFGNAIFDYVLQVESTLFPKLLSHNCVNFQFDQCNFSRKHMKAKDRFEDMNKEGCGRVVLYKQFGIIHSYTLECGYHTNTQDNILQPCTNTGNIYKIRFRRNANGEKIYDTETLLSDPMQVVQETASATVNSNFQFIGYQDDPLDHNDNAHYQQQIPMYNSEIFVNLGRSIVITILDVWGKNPYPRDTLDPNQIRRDIASNNRKMDRFKKEQSHLKTKQKNIVQLIEEQYYHVWLKKNIFNPRIVSKSVNSAAMSSSANNPRTNKILSMSRPKNMIPKKDDTTSLISKDIKDSKELRDLVKELRDHDMLQPNGREVAVKQIKLSLHRGYTNTEANPIMQRKTIRITSRRAF